VRVSRPKGGHKGGFRVSSEVGVGVRTAYFVLVGMTSAM